MGQQYINYGSFDSWQNKILTRNDALKQHLDRIKALIEELEGVYVSNAAQRILENIRAMVPVFEEYYEVVDNYKIFVKNTGSAYESTEQTNVQNADRLMQR